MAASVYTTKAKLAAAGMPIAACSPEEVNDLIRGAGAMLENLLRGLRFFPLEETVDLDGRDTALVERGNGLPILSVSELTVDRERTHQRARAFTGFGSGMLGGIQPPTPVARGGAARFDWPAGSWVLRPEPQALFVHAVQGVFPAGVANVRVRGVFGFCEAGSEKAFETTLSAELTATAGHAELTAVAGLQPRDVLVLGNDLSTAVTSIVGSVVAGAPNRVEIDPLKGVLGAALPAGTKVRSWGAVPREIEKAVNLLCARERARGRVWARGGSHDPGLLRRQWTDGFGFELHAPGGGSSSGSGNPDIITGVSEVDRILVGYLKSVWARAV